MEGSMAGLAYISLVLAMVKHSDQSPTGRFQNLGSFTKEIVWLQILYLLDSRSHIFIVFIIIFLKGTYSQVRVSPFLITAA